MSEAPLTKQQGSEVELKPLNGSSSEDTDSDESYTSFSDEEQPMFTDTFSDRTASLAEVSDLDTTPVDSGTDTENSSERDSISGTPQPSEKNPACLSPVEEVVTSKVHPGQKQRQKRGFFGSKVAHTASVPVSVTDAGTADDDSAIAGDDFAMKSEGKSSKHSRLDSSVRFEEEDPIVLETMLLEMKTRSSSGYQLYKGDERKKQRKRKKRRKKKKRSSKRTSTGVRSVDSSSILITTSSTSTASKTVAVVDDSVFGCYCGGSWFGGWSVWNSTDTSSSSLASSTSSSSTTSPKKKRLK